MNAYVSQKFEDQNRWLTIIIKSITTKSDGTVRDQRLIGVVTAPPLPPIKEKEKKIIEVYEVVISSIYNKTIKTETPQMPPFTKDIIVPAL